ncbi:hypothetical protein HanLR1_Chr09g0301421 [Helianthus annuus]|nr:hypothetical protein HanHA89_Chr09g0321721 [Helianthus annuus]KAJ0705967.1 hypothetical protein HanLR1_Chr09g0301421 [Helianthus annuus]
MRKSAFILIYHFTPLEFAYQISGQNFFQVGDDVTTRTFKVVRFLRYGTCCLEWLEWSWVELICDNPSFQGLSSQLRFLSRCVLLCAPCYLIVNYCLVLIC